MRIIHFLGPLAIILASALQFAADNTEYTTAHTLNFLLAALTCGYCALWLGLRLLLGHQAVEKIIFWFAVLWLVHLLVIYAPLSHFLGLKGVDISTWVGISLILSVLIFQKKLPYSSTIHSALLVIGLANGAAAFPSAQTIYADLLPSEGYHDVELALAEKTPVVKPHVLYIVPDRYPSPALLQEAFDYDNAAFVDVLSSKGFYIWNEQFSNYGKTFLSLASTLNMNYLDRSFKEQSGGTSYLPIIELMKNNQFLRILKANGYQYNHMGGWWQPTKSSPFADSTLFADGMDEFIGTYLLTTPLGYISDKLDAFRNTCEHMQLQANFAMETARKEKPQFIFWHVFSIHPPYIFDDSGDCLAYPTTEGDWNKEKDNIVNQIVPTNALLLELIADIQENSSRPVIIIIQADEGPVPQMLGALNLDYLRLPPHAKRIKYGIMNAVYFPSGNYEGFDEQQSPVNNFRLVLREIFQTPLPLLPHKYYSFQYEENPYDMRDISAELMDGKNSKHSQSPSQLQ